MYTLKFHLHTLNCNFWLNLWIGNKSVRFIYCCKKDDIIRFVSTKHIRCDSVLGVMLKNRFLDDKVHALGSKMLPNLVVLVIECNFQETHLNATYFGDKKVLLLLVMCQTVKGIMVNLKRLPQCSCVFRSEIQKWSKH